MVEQFASDKESASQMQAPFLQAPFRLHLPEPTARTMHEDLALLREAYQRDPESNALRYSFATELNYQDLYEEAIALLEVWNVPEPRFQLLSAHALISRETPEANRTAQGLCCAGLLRALNLARRADLLATLAKTHIRLGELDEARAALAQALALDPQSRDAYKRISALALTAGQPQQVLDHAAQMIDSGVLHSRVIASQALAFAQLGWIDEARQVAGLDRFLKQFDPAPPAGWDSLEAFSAAVADEMRGHPGQRFNRYGTASAQTWRVDKPEHRNAALVPQLQRLIQREVETYVSALAGSEPDHPFLRARPTRALLRNWCVITEGDGHETWHVHQNGWLSGVFYPYVQDHIAHGTGPEGCIAFGLPEEIVGAGPAAQFGEHLIRPHTGLMMLFPSHSYHRTYPHFGPGRRICYAFDCVPDRDH